MAIQKRNDELVDLLSADFLRKRYPLTATDRFGGAVEMTIELFDGTTIAIIDTSIFDPVDLLHYSADVAADTTDSRSIVGMLARGESINLFDVSGDTVQLRLTSGGDVEIQRTAGTAAYAIVLRLRFMFDVYSATSKRFTILADRVGVLNNAPAFPLHVGAGTDTPVVSSPTIYAATEASTSIVARDTLNNIEAFMFAGSSLVLLGSATNHSLRLRTNNADRVHIDATGVGIGNTAPNVLLHVGGGLDTYTTSAVAIAANAAGAASIVARNSTDNVEILLTAGTAAGYVGTATSHTLNLRTNNTERIVILGTGNVGIAQAAPAALLHIGAGVDALTTTAVALTVQIAGAASAVVRNDTDNVEVFATAGNATGYFGTATNHDLRLRANNADAMTILADGKVGVANTAPGYQFQVGAGADTLVRTETALAVQIAGVATITARDATNNAECTIIAASGGGFFGTATNHNIHILANNANVARFTTAGAFGIIDGITAPSTLASVAWIYVDTADGDLKVKFGDGTIKTLATDT